MSQLNLLPAILKTTAGMNPPHNADHRSPAISYLVTKHKEADKNKYNKSQESKEKKSIKKLKARADKIYKWLDTNDEKIGTQGKPIKSNIVDNESAKLSTGHGVIQGYNGIAAVDDKHQVVILM